jgi:hypothetical protein
MDACFAFKQRRGAIDDLILVLKMRYNCVYEPRVIAKYATYSNIGYHVLANDVDELGGYISYLVAQERALNIEIILY